MTLQEPFVSGQAFTIDKSPVQKIKEINILCSIVNSYQDY